MPFICRSAHKKHDYHLTFFPPQLGVQEVDLRVKRLDLFELKVRISILSCVVTNGIAKHLLCLSQTRLVESTTLRLSSGSLRRNKVLHTLEFPILVKTI